MISRALLNAPFFIPKDADLLRNRKVNTKKRQNRHLPELAFLILGTYFTAPFYSRLGGFEPPLLPPEGSALSPELQTQILILRLFQEHKHYFNILFSKSKEDLDTASGQTHKKSI